MTFEDATKLKKDAKFFYVNAFTLEIENRHFKSITTRSNKSMQVYETNPKNYHSATDFKHYHLKNKDALIDLRAEVQTYMNNLNEKVMEAVKQLVIINALIGSTL